MKNENQKRKRSEAPQRRRRPFQYFNELRGRGGGNELSRGKGGRGCVIDRYIYIYRIDTRSVRERSKFYFI